MKYPDQYLHVEECRSGQTWIVPFDENAPLDLKHNIEQWIANSGFADDFELDGQIMPKLDGDFYAKIITDNRPPDSAVVWQAGGFYLKSISH